MSTLIYKILRPTEWHTLQSEGLFKGSADDLRDGFIHFSTAAQLQTSTDLYFQDVDRVVFAAVDAGGLKEEEIKWEVSRGGKAFPHLYRDLLKSDVQENWTVDRTADGQIPVPADILET